MTDSELMGLALEEARKAAALGANNEFQHIFFAVERLHGIGNHFVVVFDDDNRSPEANHVEVGTSTHQAGFEEIIFQGNRFCQVGNRH